MQQPIGTSSNSGKTIFFKLLNGMGIVISYLSTPRLSKAVKYLRNATTTHYLARQFKKTGKNPFFEHPAHILGAKHIVAGDNLYIFPRTRIEVFDQHLTNVYTPSMVIGDNVWINYDCHIACVNKITIGNNVVIASKVFITDHYHGEISREALCLPPGSRNVISKGPVIIEDNVLIGEGAVILPNIRIGKNAIIGANTVVTHDVKENTVVAGVPAKIIKNYNE